MDLLKSPISTKLEILMLQRASYKQSKTSKQELGGRYDKLMQVLQKPETRCTIEQYITGEGGPITESVDSVRRDTTYTQYMLIQKNLSNSQKRYTYKPL